MRFQRKEKLENGGIVTWESALSALGFYWFLVGWLVWVFDGFFLVVFVLFCNMRFSI